MNMILENILYTIIFIIIFIGCENALSTYKVHKFKKYIYPFTIFSGIFFVLGVMAVRMNYFRIIYLPQWLIYVIAVVAGMIGYIYTCALIQNKGITGKVIGLMATVTILYLLTM